MEKKYDIFISFKNKDKNGNSTKDSVIANELYEFLTQKGFKVFFSNRELEYLGKAQYTRVIDNVLDSVNILIAVGCSFDNLDSQWVRYEWESFLSDIRNNTKPNAELFCVYADMKRENLPRPLRQQQAFDASKKDSFERLYTFIFNSMQSLENNKNNISENSKPVYPEPCCVEEVSLPKSQKSFFGFFSKKEKKQKQERAENSINKIKEPICKQSSDIIFFNDSITKTATTLIQSDDFVMQTDTPYLIRIKNNERINLNKPVFRIGRGSFVDYLIENNPIISLNHANITTHNGEYFVKDVDSTNHTYINDTMIQSNIEIKLEHGAKIKLANEEFEFRLYQKENKIKTDSIQFTAACQKEIKPAYYAEIDIYASTKEEQNKINEIIEKEFGKGEYKTKESRLFDIEVGAKLKIVLSSDDIFIEDNCEEMVWRGKYGKVSFQVYIPKEYNKPQIMFKAKVYCDETPIPLCKLAFSINIQKANQTQNVESIRFKKPFVSYASEDRVEVLARLHGMRHIAPYLDLFMDIISLRGGENWKDKLMEEIPLADIFLLFWSHNAIESEWVAKEWKYAYEQKGIDFIEPIPLESSRTAPIPQELKSKHCNDLLLILENYYKMVGEAKHE